MSAASWRLGNLIAFVDMNGLQADGPTRQVMAIEPQDARWQAFGWHTQRVDGNNTAALLQAVDEALGQANPEGQPHVILCDTTVGKGVPMLEAREKLHFMKIDQDEWPRCKQQLTAGHRGSTTR